MTDNTEAVDKLEALAESLALSYSAKEAINEILAAIGADLFAYFPPKPMEWVKADGPYGNIECDTIVGRYKTNGAHNGGFTVSVGKRILKTPEGLTNFPTLEAAKSAAEAHRNEKLLKEFAK